MFRLQYIKISGHKQLGDLELKVTDVEEESQLHFPYTTVIIGPNGTGKSYILRTIAEIFRQLNGFQNSEKAEFNLPFDLNIKYSVNGQSFNIEIYRIKGKRKRIVNVLKNFPSAKQVVPSGDITRIIKSHLAKHNEVRAPHKLIVSSVMTTDRFVYQDSKPEDFYQYLGARSTSSTASTKSASRRTIRHLFNATQNKRLFKENLEDLLRFLHFDKSLKVHYTTRVNKLFFSGDLSVHNFKMFFENWWDPNFEFSKRKKENPIWSIPYYNNHFKNNEDALQKIVDYLNYISSSPNRLIPKPKARSRIFPVDIFDEDISNEEIELISHLENLDIINLEGIKVNKDNSNLSIEEVSSGEYHLLISFIGIFANIENDSLVLIDEPEISLHPNWQMKYISFLKRVFSKYSNCHFILTTHSHFLVSDLDSKSSSVIALRKDKENQEVNASLLENINTYGWPAEEVLLKVFNTASDRNYFLAEKIGSVLELISENDKSKMVEIRKQINELRNVDFSGLSKEDPLKEVINKLFKRFN